MKSMNTLLAMALAVAVGSSTAAAQGRGTRGKQPPATKPPAQATAAAPPQVSAVALRVTGVGFGANGTELKPFNESPGTSVVLAIEAPKGNGIVDIDDHGSKVESFVDDKGQSLMEEARVGPFPKVTEDGSVALVEVEVRGRPSTGASSVAVQGSIAMTLAGGSKPFRAANVRLDANQTFKIGATTLTISEPKVEDESTEFTVNLPRSLLATIREIRFFDAKNAPLEGQRRGSGYFNEKAQLELSAKTKDKVIGLEFELWQSLRTIKVPFTVQAGLGIAAGGRAAGTTDGTPAKDEGPVKSEPAPKKPEGPPPTISASEGAASVDAVVKQMQTSALAGKGAQVLSVIYPTERGDYAQGVAMSLAFLPMASMDDQKAAEALQKELDTFFTKHNLKAPFTREPADLFKGVDLNTFVSEAFTFIKTHAKKGDKPQDMLPVPQGKAENIKTDGDSATATLNGKEATFSKISGRWFIHLK
jgi:hypothetical protein